MAAFNIFRKSNSQDWVTLPQPDDSVSFFETIKSESEKYWSDTIPNKSNYGFQFQQHTKWNYGLSETELGNFEEGHYAFKVIF